jgi:hypothetical protein
MNDIEYFLLALRDHPGVDHDISKILERADEIKDKERRFNELQADKLRVNTFVRDESVRLSNYRDNGVYGDILVAWCDFWTMKKILASTRNQLASNDEYAKARCRFFTLNGFH